MENKTAALPEPKNVFKYFYDICSIPHGSGNTKAISDYCVRFAEENNLRYIQDSFNNVIIFKDASAGCENAPTVIIQGHLDMVCEAEDGFAIDFEKDGLKVKTDNDFVYADGTSLGGDDGIAVAYALAILSDTSLVHPRIEAVFTTDEETGMTGAANLDCTALQGRIMLNIDSEEEGIFTVSCAGGAKITQSLPLDYEKTDTNSITVTVSGLTGGHSGTEIHHGRGSAIILLARMLKSLRSEFNFGFSDFCGGTKDNAIPTNASCRIFADSSALSEITDRISAIEQTFKAEFEKTDPNLKICVRADEKSGKAAFTDKTADAVLELILGNPCGVISMSRDIDGLVQTSVNCGSVCTTDTEMLIRLAPRSSSASELEEIVGKIVSLCTALGGMTDISGSYPPWEYNRNSEISRVCARVYKELYGKDAVVTAIHAGLECGIFAGKMPDLDCISFGPDIFDIHTHRERLSISSAARVWQFLVKTLEEIGNC